MAGGQWTWTKDDDSNTYRAKRLHWVFSVEVDLVRGGLYAGMLSVMARAHDGGAEFLMHDRYASIDEALAAVSAWGDKLIARDP